MDPFVSAADLSAFLNETVTDDDLITRIALDSACQIIRTAVGQDINLARSDIELHDGNGREVILLRQLPVVEVSMVLEDDVELAEADDYVLGSSGFLLRRGSSVWSYLSGSWSVGRQNIEVVYDHGWAITEDDVVDPGSGGDPAVGRVPSDIRAIALSLASRVLRASRVSATGIKTGESLGAYSYTQDATQAVIDTQVGLLDTERLVIDRYRTGA